MLVKNIALTINPFQARNRCCSLSRCDLQLQPQISIYAKNRNQNHVKNKVLLSKPPEANQIQYCKRSSYG